ncbi:MAG: hypothetical protein U0324_35220 [Polyangiales bacterium]
MSMILPRADHRAHDARPDGADLDPETLYFCVHCERSFLGCDARPCRFFGGRQACAFDGCTASAEGLDIFPVGHPYLTGEVAPDDVDGRHEMRLEIVDADDPDDPDELIRFGELRLGALAELLERDLLAPDAKHNRAPTAAEFGAFLCRWPEARLHGHVLPPTDDRDDGAVRIEGASCELTPLDEPRRTALRAAFGALAKTADERVDDVDWVYASWD